MFENCLPLAHNNSLFILPSPFNFVVVLVAVIMAAGVLKYVCRFIRDVAMHRQELSFKREMIDRGLAADEIETLIRARGIDLAEPFNDE